MADSQSQTSPPTTEPNSQTPEPENPNPQSNQPDSSSSTASISVPVNPNPTQLPLPLPPPPPIPPQLASLPQLLQPNAPPPSFRPLAPPPAAPHFSPLPNPNFQNPNVQQQQPGVSPVPGMMMSPMMMSYAPPPGQAPNPAFRSYVPMPNGFPQGTIPPPGLLRYPSPYTTFVRPAFPPRPPGTIGVIPALSYPPIPGLRGPIMTQVFRPPVIPSVTPTEKPQTTVYVGKIASTVENDFMLSLLQLCGPVKNWKRAQDPTSGTPKGFGFCEFDSAEGILRALRLLSKLNVDGQVLVLNVTQATREYLERYVKNKSENSKKLKATGTEGSEKEEESVPDAEKSEPPDPSVEDTNKDEHDSEKKENHDVSNLGTVTDEDREADREALEKLTSMLEERLKTRPPLPEAIDDPGNPTSELPASSKDRDSDVDVLRNEAAEDKNDDEMTSESKPVSEHDRPETSSPDRGRRYDRRSRDKERDLKRDKERELERYEREREQERASRERERETKIRDDDRRYRFILKDWESREREKERSRKLEKEREKEKEYKRRREITDQERENDDGDTRKRKHKSSGSEERKKRLREKEEDLGDRLKEEEEIEEVKRKTDEEKQEQGQREKDELKLVSVHVSNGSDETLLPLATNVEGKDMAVEQTSDGDSGHGIHIGDGILQNGAGDESVIESMAASDTQQSGITPARKFEFGIVGSGKRTAVPSVFHEEEDEDAQKEKRMRPLVPIDYSTEELQAVVQPTASGDPSPNLVAAAEFAKRISTATPKEERPDGEKERSRRSHDRHSHRDRDRNGGETSYARDDNRKETSHARDDNRKDTTRRERDREHGIDKVKTLENQKVLDARQLIDMIPRTKEELFSYEINWVVFDKNELHERIRPWISKKIIEFLGEEEPSLVDFIVSTTREHVKASEMLERMQAILDDEAEMFVLKMWRTLIFEIKKVETGLAGRS